MILVDLSQTIIAVAMQNLKGDYNKELLRAMVFQTLVSYKKKFGAEYGNLVLAIDSKGVRSWRKQKYPFYKANRAKKFDDPKEAAKWKLIFEIANDLISECKEFLTWKTVGSPGAEADDVIGVLASIFAPHEKILIVSTDDDFTQLQTHPNVKQWGAIQKKWIKTDNALASLHEKILRGDKGDGIPNILSPNNTLVDGIRQKSVTEGILKEWMSNSKDMEAKYSERIAENRELIDFSNIPSEIRANIIAAYDDAPVNGINKLFNYFLACRMARIMEDLDFFKVKQGSYGSANICADEDFFA